MKIQSIGNFYNPSFKSVENQPKEKKKFSTKEKAVYGITGAAALGIGAYFLLRGKGSNAVKKITKNTDLPLNVNTQTTPKPSPLDNFKPYFDKEYEIKKSEHKNFSSITYKAVDGDETYRDILVFNKENKLVRRINDYRNKNGKMWSRVYKGDETNILIHPDKFPKSRYDSDYLVKEFSGDARKPFGLNKEGTERLTRAAYPDGNSKTYQGFFNKNNKLHEYKIYYDSFDNSLGCFDKLHQAQSNYIIKYDYAYKDGKLAGIAKQEILKDNNWYGIYQNNGFDAFPQYVDLKDGKGFQEFKGDLYIQKPEFDPDNF